MSASLSRFNIPESLDDLPDDIRKAMLAVQEKAGFVPNVFLMLAHRPAEFRAFFAYHDALMERESDTLTKAEKEMIVVATSAANDCLYCVVAHGAILRIYEKNPLIADQIATNYRKAAISPRQRAMLDYCVLLSVRPEDVDDADHDALRAAGVGHALAMGARNVLVNTCTLDSDRALPNYLARGFVTVREVTGIRNLPDVSPGPWDGA